MYYDSKQAVKSGDINMAALAKYTRRKDKNSSDRQSKATIDKPKSKQKNTPKLRCIFCCDRVVVLCWNFIAVFVAVYFV